MRTLADIQSDLATPEEVAEVTPFTRQTIQRMLRRGDIPGTKWGGRWFVNVPALSNQLAGQVVPGPSSAPCPGTPGPGEISRQPVQLRGSATSPSAASLESGRANGISTAGGPAGGGSMSPSAVSTHGERTVGGAPSRRSA